MKRYFIGDLHLGHYNCLGFDNRPFKTNEEQDKYILKHWNERVTDDDEVYILGDVSFYSAFKTIELLNQLKGKKFLVIGNHDNKLLKSLGFRECFTLIDKDFTIKLEPGVILYLSHHPSPFFDKAYYGSYHFYAHVHNSYEENLTQNLRRRIEALYDKPHNMMNVGAMSPAINYVPRTMEEILAYDKGHYVPGYGPFEEGQLEALEAEEDRLTFGQIIPKTKHYGAETK